MAVMVDRVVGLIDMDCFYAQVEQREKPELWGTPVAVVQPSGPNSLGGSIAVSYEARSFGVKRGMMVPEMKKLCPEINIAIVPLGEHVDKPDINKYRLASAEVFDVITHFDDMITVEKASVDEAFLDLTQLVDHMIGAEGTENIINKYLEDLPSLFPTSHVGDGSDIEEKKENEESTENERQRVYDREENLRKWIEDYCRTSRAHMRIAVGAQIIEQIRARVTEQTKFFCSAGISVNKMMAKLVCARHKPRQQTLAPPEFSSVILQHTPIQSVRFLGGNTGRNLRHSLNIKTMGELCALPLEVLAQAMPGHATWLYQIARGIDDEPVKDRLLQSSIAVSKQYPGRQALKRSEDVRTWVQGLSKELRKRLMNDQTQNKRTAQKLMIGVHSVEGHVSRTVNLLSYEAEDIATRVWAALIPLNKAANKEDWEPIMHVLSLSASRFVQGIHTQSLALLNWISNSKSGGEPLNADSPSTSVEVLPTTSSELPVVGEEDEFQDLLPTTSSRDESPEIVCLDDDPVTVGGEVNNAKKPDPPAAERNQEPGKSAGSTSSTTTARLTSVRPSTVEVPSDRTLAPPPEIDPAVFASLPREIQEELIREYKLSQARELKKKAERGKKTESVERVRTTNTAKGAGEKQTKEGTKRKRGADTERGPSKKINQFFAKK